MTAKESAAAGHAYRAGLEDLDWYIAGDEIRLHYSRHTILSLMEGPASLSPSSASGGHFSWGSSSGWSPIERQGAVDGNSLFARPFGLCALAVSMSPVVDHTCHCQYHYHGYVASEEAQIDPAIGDQPLDTQRDQ